MTKYLVISLTIQGRGNRIFRAGDEIKQSDLYPSAIYSLLRTKAIREITDIKPEDPTPFVAPIKIAICTGVWKRPEVFELFARGCDNLKSKSKIPIEIIVAGSEGVASKRMVEAKGYHYIETPNDPLATKMNLTILKAKALNATHVICVGSDDIITPGLLEKYIEFIKLGYDYIGVLDWYFYDTVTGKSLYWGGYKDERRKGHTCGAGRVLSANLLSKWGWQPWEIKDSKVLDNSMQNKLKKTAHSIKTFSLKEFNLYALDIKSSTNMTPFALWDNAIYIDSKIIKKNFYFLGLEPCVE